MKNVIYLFVVLVWSSCTNVDRKLEESTTLNNQVLQSNYDPEAKLDSLGISLRDIGNPLANYVHAARSGNLMFLAGKGPRQADGENIVGKLGQDLSVEEGYLAAREAGINQLSVLKKELGSLKKVKRIVSVHGMVNATADFTDHSKVINGYSNLMVAVFGNQGKHARAAVGMVSLPGNMAVEVEMVVEVYPE
ncbi:RidA family protein [Maribacter sp. MAR_2009_72]|uniref:RidA family protein n=1 Tax=Maribacter sp. MAR_2009_72 TaxID=1250050 RepID=UPI00119A47EB|nr:RidA family protein [Maribacter sp. MAR_2009_72]TVZ16423.1 enamine deaminase RidA (YjgF/YER057c/UK114 family) [Maribacter sp. MAR_2009_72]